MIGKGFCGQDISLSKSTKKRHLDKNSTQYEFQVADKMLLLEAQLLYNQLDVTDSLPHNVVREVKMVG